MKRVFDYQTVQHALIKYYMECGSDASVEEILQTKVPYLEIEDEKMIQRPCYYDWDIGDVKQLKQLYNHTFLEYDRINSDVDYWINKNIYHVALHSEIMIFLHFSHHKVQLRTKESLELCYVLSGEAVYHEEKEQHILKTGDLVVIGPERAHDVVAGEDSVVLGIQIAVKTFFQYFSDFIKNENFLAYIYRQILYQNRDNFFVLSMDVNREILIIIRSMLSEFSPYGAYAKDICIRYLEIFFYKLIQTYQADNITNSDTLRETEKFLAILLNELYLDRKITLKELAKKYHYSESYMSRLFRKKTGYTFQELQSSFRIDCAKKMLEQTGFSMDIIADLSGYPSQNQFARSFRTVTGMAPGEYRKRSTNAQDKDR